MELKENIKLSSDDLCKRFGIKRLGLFGSVARGDYTADSDIDFFVEFDSPPRKRCQSAILDLYVKHPLGLEERSNY